MSQEKEVKIELKIPLDEFKNRITRLGYEKQGTLQQLDTYYDTKEWYLYNNIAALRTRNNNGTDHSFSFKKVFYMPRRKNKYYVEEIETHFPLTDTKALDSVFTRLNIKYTNNAFETSADLSKFLLNSQYIDSVKIKKVRETYAHEQNEITIDDVSGVGIIIELECKKDEPTDLINHFLKDSEWSRTVEGLSYAWMRKNLGLTSHLNGLELFKTNPTWNVWENERKMYEMLNVEVE